MHHFRHPEKLNFFGSRNWYDLTLVCVIQQSTTPMGLMLTSRMAIFCELKSVVLCSKESSEVPKILRNEFYIEFHSEGKYFQSIVVFLHFY